MTSTLNVCDAKGRTTSVRVEKTGRHGISYVYDGDSRIFSSDYLDTALDFANGYVRV
ncbi:hypothetical protein HOT75_gp163 [Gordonia phage Daredevil]|uniref:Uncharacterized protein n=1 Tax=Gordonia phage Daredevil TaxID=2283286 RepID=A0A345MJ18_9CAUD|nr:hypothetical protein HOT75_gp163 [Gordonia phage Daredevil]AXH70549.1 hypothetical protein SEA_DAREDEVIL_163 [Gordonia phage Daredevil]